jgi:hypothetical protein
VALSYAKHTDSEVTALVRAVDESSCEFLIISEPIGLIDEDVCASVGVPVVSFAFFGSYFKLLGGSGPALAFLSAGVLESTEVKKVSLAVSITHADHSRDISSLRSTITTAVQVA